MFKLNNSCTTENIHRYIVHIVTSQDKGSYILVIRTVSVFFQDDKNEKQELPFQHQDEISDKLGEAEGLLKDLFLDVDKAKKLQHPQAKDIESEYVFSSVMHH